MTRTSLGAVLVLAAVAAWPRPAAAERPKPWQVYGALTLEGAMAGTFYLNFSDLNDRISEAPRITIGTVGTLVLPIGGGYLAHRLDLDPRPGLALHGALWYGVEGFVLGSFIDGREESWGLRAGRTAWTLGAVGAVSGAVIGARFVDGRDESARWLAAPPAGFAIGGFVLGGLLVLVGGVDGDAAPGQLATGATVGLGVGLGVATVLAVRGTGDTSPSRLAALARYLPRLAVGDRAVTVSLGGKF